MKPKGALFISAALTTFVLAITVSVVTAFNNGTGTNELKGAANPTQVVATATVPLDPSATPSAQVGPEQAASIAAQFINATDVYSVEVSSLNGVQAFKVVFSSGNVVYVGLDGQVMLTTQLQPTVVVDNSVPAPAPQKKSHSSGGDDHHNEHEGGDD